MDQTFCKKSGVIIIHIRSILPLLIIVLVIIPETVSSNTIGDIDHDLFDYVNKVDNGFLDSAMPIVQGMGDPKFYLAICAILSGFGNERMFETGKLASAAFVESGIIVFLMKESIGRSRPSDITEKDSFPSGHSTLAFTMATVAGNQYPKLRIPLYIGAIGTAFARVYLGRHYPSDVLAGAAIGTLVGIQISHFRNTIMEFSF